MIFHHFYKGKQLLCLPVCFSGQCSPFKIWSNLKGKNQIGLLLKKKILLREQILSFKGLPLMRWKVKIKELLPLKLYPFTLIPLTYVAAVVFIVRFIYRKKSKNWDT